MTDATPAYTVTARTLHWVTASLVLFNLPLGLVIATQLGRSAAGSALQPAPLDRRAHHSRHPGAPPLPLGHPPAPLPDDIPPLQQLAADATHWALYALLIVQPFLGWIGTSAYPAQIVVFGLFELPPIWHEDRAFSDRVLFVHSLVGPDHRGPAGRPYRRRAASSFRAPGRHPDPHDHGLRRARDLSETGRLTAGL